MPTVELEKPKLHRYWTKALAALVIVVGLIGAGRWAWQWRLAADQSDYRQAIKNETLSGLTKNYSAAVAGWEKYRNGWPPRSYQYEAAMHEGELLETMKDPKDALALYRVAEANHKGDGTAEYTGIARISEEQGDYATAITYYQKAADLYKSYHMDNDGYYWIMGHIQYLRQKEQSGANQAAK